MNATPTLHIRLFGALDLRLDDVPLALESARAESLLAFLLLQRDAPQTRRAIAFQLWPDSSEAQALTNLRHVLHTLRHALPDADHYIAATSRTLQWRADAPYRLDVEAFSAALARADQCAGDELAALREAVGLYAGELLEGCYDEWLLVRREELQRRYLAALVRLTQLHAERGEQAEAIPLAERLLRHDPLDEGAWRLLMQLHAAHGDQARALRAYHACAATLERDLGVEPSLPTRRAYEALLASGPEEHADAEPVQGTAGRLPLVGRAEEWARLIALWRAADSGRACCLLVAGEAGSGKTRLVEELRAWCAQRGAIVAEGRSYAAEGALAYGPVIDWLRSVSISAHRERLSPAMRTELARLVPEMLVADPALPPPRSLPEDDQRQRLYDALAQALLIPGQPLLLIADDLHWSDRETLGFLHYLLRTAPQARLLVAATARSEELDARPMLREFLIGLRAIERLETLELGPLRRNETLVLAERIAGRELSRLEADHLYAATEGNPLFVVEAVRAGWQEDAAGPTPLTPRVQAAIESRLGQVSAEARDLAGVAATIGRAFNTDVLRAAAGFDEDELVRALDELWRRRIVREQDIDAYDFSHPLILEVAYQTAGPAQRRQRHARVARALERLHAADPLPVSAQIAAHYDRAGQYDRAVSWYGQAAEAAARVYARDETVRLLERAVGLLRAQPSIPKREERELELLTALPGPLLAIEGYRSERLMAVQQRALELAEALGRELEPPLLRSLALSNLAQGDFDAARAFGRRLYTRGESDADDVLLVEADYVLGIASFWEGEFGDAQRAFEGVAARYRPERRREHLLRYGQDPSLTCAMRLACTLWFLGRPDAAARLREETLALAAAAGHPYSHALAHSFAVLLSIEMRDFERARALIAAPVGKQSEIGPVHLQANLRLFGGFVDVLDGQIDSGIARIQQPLFEPRTLNEAPGIRAFHTRILLEACRVGERPETGIAAAGRMLDDDHEQLWHSEAHRLRAEFLAALGAPPDNILADLMLALDVATRQGALMPRLRAATSLLRFQVRHGDAAAVADARRLAATALAELTEGHATEEVRDAITLLNVS